MKIAICDDDRYDRNIIEDYCKAFNPDYSLSSFSSSTELLDAFETDFYDMVLLDIEMEAPNGYESALKLIAKYKYSHPLIIFITHSEEYAARGYGIAFRYLVKPVSYPLFSHTLHTAEATIIPKRIHLSCVGGESRFVSISDICYLESYGHKLIFHMDQEKDAIIFGKISEYQDLLKNSFFIRIHKSYCINLNHIDYIKLPLVFMKNGISLPISRSRQPDFLSVVENYFHRQ